MFVFIYRFKIWCLFFRKYTIIVGWISSLSDFLWRSHVHLVALLAFWFMTWALSRWGLPSFHGRKRKNGNLNIYNAMTTNAWDCFYQLPFPRSRTNLRLCFSFQNKTDLHTWTWHRFSCYTLNGECLECKHYYLIFMIDSANGSIFLKMGVTTNTSTIFQCKCMWVWTNSHIF